MTNEEWYEIPGYGTTYSKYLVNKAGQVKIPLRPSAYTRGKTNVGGNLLLPQTYPNGYKYYNLRSHGKYKSIMIHRLIAIMFIPNPENKPQVNHKNGIKDDNRIENLEWCTHSENSRHAFETGLWKPKRGIACTSVKLTEDEVREIKRLKSIPIGKRPRLTEIAKKYNVGQTIVCNIINGKKWKHIQV